MPDEDEEGDGLQLDMTGYELEVYTKLRAEREPGKFPKRPKPSVPRILEQVVSESYLHLAPSKEVDPFVVGSSGSGERLWGTPQKRRKRKRAKRA
jgi:hypothetical protein